jgi:hypothetical protein
LQVAEVRMGVDDSIEVGDAQGGAIIAGPAAWQRRAAAALLASARPLARAPASRTSAGTFYLMRPFKAVFRDMQRGDLDG